MVVAVMCRMALGAWFVHSGISKWQGGGLDRFVQDVANYRLVAAPWDEVVAYGVWSLECMAGLALFFGILRRGALVCLAGLVVVFATAVTWAWHQQLDISCGCRGGGGSMHYAAKWAEFALYAVVLGMLGWAEAAGKLASTAKKHET